MADPLELFRILDDDGTGAGTAIDKAIDATTAAAALRGLVGFAFKDADGKVILPQLTADGKLPVDTEFSGGDKRHAKGELAAGSTSLVAVTGAEITITGGIVANEIGAVVSCLHSSLFQLVYVDDAGGTPVETVLEEAIVGPGQYSFRMGCKNLSQDVSGGTGDQKLIIKAMNFHKQSSLRACIDALDSAGS